MKKILFVFSTALLVGCSASQAPSSMSANGFYDMQAVQDYQARIASGNTATEKQKQLVRESTGAPMPLNDSDRNVNKNKTRTMNNTPISIVPAIGVGYYRGYGHRYW